MIPLGTRRENVLVLLCSRKELEDFRKFQQHQGKTYTARDILLAAAEITATFRQADVAKTLEDLSERAEATEIYPL